MSEGQLVLREPLQHELAQIDAKAALTVMGVESAVRWRYAAERVVRNLSGIGQRLFDTVGSKGELPESASAVALATARGWENISRLEERSHRATALLNAALFYEIAGYQANAACLARSVVPSRRWSSEPSFDGLVSALVQRLFLRVRSLGGALAKLPSSSTDMPQDEIQRQASFAVAALALDKAAAFFLSGDDSSLNSALDDLALALRGLGDVGDAVGYNTLAGLKAVLPLMAHRSIWRELSSASAKPRWARYLRVLARGVGSDILDARSVSELWPSQRAALEGGLLQTDKHLAIRMPTGAGKTRIAELAMVHTLMTQPGSKCVYIAPYRALASEVEVSLTNVFVDLGLAITAIPGGYDQDDMGEVVLDRDDVLVVTPEKLDLLLRLKAEALGSVSLVVLDEAHMVGDHERGPKLELMLSRLRRRMPSARFITMSAVVPNQTIEDFAEWLGRSREQAISSDWRPSLLRYALLDWDGGKGTLRFSEDDVVEGGLEFVPNVVTQKTYEYVAEDTGRRRRPRFPGSTHKGELAAELAYRFVQLGPVLIFAMQTDWAESVARALMRRVKLTELVGEAVVTELRVRSPGRAAGVAREWLGPEHEVTRLLERGIAFHHGRLPDAVREAVEEDFRSRRLAVLVATSTLGQGVNLPVRTVIVHSARGRDPDGNPRMLSARDYWNVAGRAGRAGLETEGTVVHVGASWRDTQDFEFFASRRNAVEPVTSALFEMLGALVEGRITSEEAAAQLDADLLALLVEEDVDLLSTEDLAKTLESSLFRIQALHAEVSVEPLLDVMTQTTRNIAVWVPNAEDRKLFATTGLSSKSCRAIKDHVRANMDVVGRLLETAKLDELEELLDLLIQGTAEVWEMEPRTELALDTRSLLSKWVEGQPVGDIATEEQVDAQELAEYIQDVFSYRLPWGVSSYLRIGRVHSEIESLSPLAGNVAGMIKFGVPVPEAAWAMTAGVASRRAALSVADEYLRSNLDGAAADFRRWLGRLDVESLAAQLELAGAELESTARAVLRSQPNAYLQGLDEAGDLFPLDTECRVARAALERGIANALRTGDPVEVIRDRDSTINRNAVYLVAGGHRVGYLPVDASRAVGPEMDSGVNVVGRVTHTIGELEDRGVIGVRVLARSELATEPT